MIQQPMHDCLDGTRMQIAVAIFHIGHDIRPAGPCGAQLVLRFFLLVLFIFLHERPLHPFSLVLLRVCSLFFLPLQNSIGRWSTYYWLLSLLLMLGLKSSVPALRRLVLPALTTIFAGFWLASCLSRKSKESGLQLVHATVRKRKGKRKGPICPLCCGFSPFVS